MRKLLLIIIALFMVTTAYAVGEPKEASVTAMKIGVVDVRQVLQKIPQMTEVNSQLEKQFKPRQDKIVEAQKSLKESEDKLNKEGAVMGDTQRSALQDKIIAERANTQAMISTFQQDLSNAQNRSMQKLLAQIAGVVNKIAKDDKYDLILQGENVPYVSDKLNVTERVIQEMKAK
jgi:outer membrane protein